jgi:predicted dehydrogenase
MAEIKTAGVIGYGSAGAKHYRAYVAAGLDVVFYDPHYESSSLAEVLDCGVVSICSPDDTHYEYLLDAIRHDKHVLVEKPLTHVAGQLGTIEEYAFRSEGVVECHLPLRYHPPFVKALGEVRAGVLGKIISIDMAYHYGRPEKLKGWRGQIPNYSLIVGGGIHLVDLAVQIVGTQDPRHILDGARCPSRLGGSQDTRSAFAIDDAVCTLTTTCHGHVPHMHEMRIIGTAGAREIQNTVEVDHSIGVRLFLDKVRTGQRGNIAEAIAANRICIQIAEALR